MEYKDKHIRLKESIIDLKVAKPTQWDFHFCFHPIAFCFLCQIGQHWFQHVFKILLSKKDFNNGTHKMCMCMCAYPPKLPKAKP